MNFHVLGRRSFMAASLAVPFAARAATLSKPTAKPILAVTGKISVTNDGTAARFDRAMLEGLGDTKFATSTPWYDKPMEFEGVPLDALMKAVGATGQRIRAVALNDYASELPIEDFAKYGTLLALKLGGEYMSVSDKGPCFIIYPFDQYPELHNAQFYSRSVWQVSSIVVI